jgi:hypothetical protein
MECQYCKKTLSSVSSLNNHQKKAKYCIKLQGIPQPSKFSCRYCEKYFTSKYNACVHEISCTDKHIDEAVINYKQQLENLKINYENQLLEKDKIVNMLNKHVCDLQDKLENVAIKGATKSTTNNKTTNKVSILTPLDLSSERLKELVEANFTNAHLLEGQKGVARFTVEHVIKDEDGKLRYICTDPARHTFRFKEGDTEIKDVRGKRLSTALAPPVMDKTGRLGMQAIKENPELFCVYSDSQQSIRDMRDDDAEFRGELASMTG